MESLNISFKYENTINHLSLETKIMLYRTIQEALTNIVRHSKANEVKIKIDIIGKNLHIIVFDNGIGTDKIIKGNGLTGIEKRVHSEGGAVKFESSKNNGFLIDISIPNTNIHST